MMNFDLISISLEKSAAEPAWAEEMAQTGTAAQGSKSCGRRLSDGCFYTGEDFTA